MPCPNSINCPGTDNPVANFSSEAPDQTIWLSTNWGFYQPPGTVFPPGNDCVIFAQSVVSQDDALACGTAAQTECVNGIQVIETSPACSVIGSNPNPPPTPPFHPRPSPPGPVIAAFSGFSCAQQDYTFTIMATGTNIPIALTVTGGSLPPGLTLTPDGVLSGSPTTPGAYSFTVTATDSNNQTSAKDMNFVVLGIVTDSVLPDGAQGTAYSQQLVGGGGEDTFVITAGSLQTGLTMNEFGLISGTPSTSGSTTFTVTVTDAFLNTCDKDFVLSVSGASGCPNFSTTDWTPATGPNWVGSAVGSGAVCTVALSFPSFTGTMNVQGTVIQTGGPCNCNLRVVMTAYSGGNPFFSVYDSLSNDYLGVIGFPTEPGTYDFPFTLPSADTYSLFIAYGGHPGDFVNFVCTYTNV
jgi:hypothetical protein